MSPNYVNRDIQCAADVGYMARLGRFGQEFTAYGCGIREHNGKIHYCAADNELKILDYMQKNKYKEMYFTPIQRISYRKTVPAGSFEEQNYQIKYELLRRLKYDYETSGFFSVMESLIATEPNNNGYLLLKRFQQKIAGNFKDAELQLFSGTVQMAYEAKILQLEFYRQLNDWERYIRKQMEDSPIVEDKFTRTLYGFCYADNKMQFNYFFDADIVTVLHQWQEKMLQGFLVAPIMHKQYWFHQMNQIASIRQEFIVWLQQYQNEQYFSLLKVLKQQPGVIDGEALMQKQDKLKQYHTAHKAVQCCNMQWNKIV